MRSVGTKRILMRFFHMTHARRRIAGPPIQWNRRKQEAQMRKPNQGQHSLCCGQTGQLSKQKPNHPGVVVSVALTPKFCMQRQRDGVQQFGNAPLLPGCCFSFVFRGKTAPSAPLAEQSSVEYRVWQASRNQKADLLIIRESHLQRQQLCRINRPNDILGWNRGDRALCRSRASLRSQTSRWTPASRRLCISRRSRPSVKWMPLPHNPTPSASQPQPPSKSIWEAIGRHRPTKCSRPFLALSSEVSMRLMNSSSTIAFRAKCLLSVQYTL